MSICHPILPVLSYFILFSKKAWNDNALRRRTQKLVYPQKVTLNREVNECYKDLPETLECSCQTLLCNGQPSCKNTFITEPAYKYTVWCRLMKPWTEIDLDNARTAWVVGDGGDCMCRGTVGRNDT